MRALLPTPTTKMMKTYCGEGEDKMTETITRIVDARALQRMRLPLNTPIQHRFFCKEYTEYWIALMGAHSAFMTAMNEASAGPRAGSRGKLRLMMRRFETLKQEIHNCDDLVGRLIAGDSEQDRDEAHILGHFLEQRAAPFVDFWREAIDAVERGETFSFHSYEIPLWVDED